MTTDPIDPAIVEKAAKALHDMRSRRSWAFHEIGQPLGDTVYDDERRADARAALEAAAPMIAARALADIRRVVESERDHARAAHQSARAKTDHLAHDYCRWVGHAEALTNTLRDIDTRADALEAGAVR